MNRWQIGLVGAALMVILSARSVHGEGAGESVVTGNGSASIPRRPDLMRLRVEISAEGKTMKDALSKMAERRKAVKQKLTELGAAEAVIEFGDVKEGGGPDQNQANQMQRVMRMRGMSRPATPTKGAKAAPKPVRVGMTVKAEWPLKSDDADQMLLAVHDLQEKIRAADVGEGKKVSPEQQEEQEEQEADFNMGGEPTVAPGEPVFWFVSKVNEDDRNKVLALAFAKAKESAQQLSRAAGRDLGALRQLNVTSTPYSEYGNWQRYQAVYQAAYGSMSENPGGGELNEVTAPTPEGMTLRVMVTAAFALK